MKALFQDSEVFVRERPTKPTEKQTEDFYRETAQEIIECGWSNSKIERIIIDLEDLSPFFDSGYELAKKLEGLGMNGSYKVDMEFLDFLDGLHSDYSELLSENIKQWVNAIKPMPERKVGDKIKLTYPIFRTPDYSEGQEFFITGIDEKEARYVIHKEKDSTGGTLIPYEKLEQYAVFLQ